MTRHCTSVLLLLIALASFSQSTSKPLTVETIMRDPKWIGSSPSAPQWSADGQQLFFSWNPDKAADDSLYFITLSNATPVKATVAQKQALVTSNTIVYNLQRTAYTYSKDGDIFYREMKSPSVKRVTQTVDIESNVQFSFNDRRIVYVRSQNLYAWDISSGETMQLTNLRSGEASPSPAPAGRNQGGNPARSTATTSPEEEWMKNDQLRYFDVLRSRKEKRELAEQYAKNTRLKELRSVPLEDKFLQGLIISPDGRFISYRLTKPATNAKSTIVPSYVTESGFTTDIPGRTKVGVQQSTSEFYMYDRDRDTVYLVKTDSLPGIKTLPDYVSDYPKQAEERKKKNINRPVTFFNPTWSPAGKYALLNITSDDNKDRWLMLWDTATHEMKQVSHQRDEAWIGGPGIFGNNCGWIDDNTCWFQSEETGYSHLYTINIQRNEKTALTSGNFEVQQAKLSNDKKYFYIGTNEVHPGELHYYRLTIATKKKEQLTTLTGSNQATLSPDEKHLAILYSYSTKPWELYLQDLQGKKAAIQVTNKGRSEEFASYAWRDPEVITFAARDGAQVYARLYKPANPDPHKPAVLFVHGAGYLQNAHKWWSSYFREYMFNNLLAENGYYVMDIDYRGSAGYGRDWRTGIYRYMGGKDLDDNVDAAGYLVKTFGVDPNRIGLYGGSYGGFITLMAMFTTPGKFAAGAALRPVTDWANYNHSYTADILNEPYNDSIAYHRSSPYYYANGLRGHLLICHGMMDVNVHYQDAVKLSQRLIELGKDNWELAPYPMEDHGFVEPSSWTDEYKRIFKLFETELKK
jgi:dipeptidyl aminopeptidase/acylaminoacyl peptidase